MSLILIGKCINPVLLFVFIFIQLSTACSTFFIYQDSHAVFGKNYDWDIGSGLVIVNKRGVNKIALANNNPAQWKSKWGSVTFNQYGSEFPMGGMNEAGLAIEVLWLNGSVYPSQDSRFEIDNMQWVQYQLDNSSTVNEVIASDTLLRVAPLSGASVHYFICDRTGNCASIEFLNGKIEVCSGKKMTGKALTNSTYAESIKYLKKYEGFGGKLIVPEGGSSLERFVLASDMVNKYNQKDSKDVVSYGFSILSNVAMGDYTKWSIIYDIKNLRIHFKTLKNKKIRDIKLSSIDFSCDKPIRVLDINTKSKGNVNSKMIDYTHNINKELIKTTFSKTDFLANIPEELLEKVIQYPTTVKCE